MTIKTKVLDRAAFYVYHGAEVTHIEGRVPDNIFTIETTPAILALEKGNGLVPYKKFCNARKRLKEMTRRAQGLPVHYMGNNTGFLLQDIARFNSWGSKRPTTKR